MAKSLENICKKFLKIDESIPVIDIVDFLEKNHIHNLDSLFLINFEGKNPESLNSNKVRRNYKHKILGFKKLSGRYGDYYHIYCKIYYRDKYEYMIFISNKKITNLIKKLIGIFGTEEVDLKINLFEKKHYGYEKMETFNFSKKELEKLEKSGKIKKIDDDNFWEKIFKREKICFYPEELNCYKGITYREINFI